MSTPELKEPLIQTINGIDDDARLEELLRLALMQSKNDNEIQRLNPKFAKQLQEIAKRMDKGEFLTHEEANREIDKWLEEE